MKPNNIRRSYLKFYSARVGLCLARDVRETFVDICLDSSGNQCCADDNQGMGTPDKRHTYWIDRSQGGETRGEIFSSVDWSIFQDHGVIWTSRARRRSQEQPGNKIVSQLQHSISPTGWLSSSPGERWTA